MHPGACILAKVLTTTWGAGGPEADATDEPEDAPQEFACLIRIVFIVLKTSCKHLGASAGLSAVSASCPPVVGGLASMQAPRAHWRHRFAAILWLEFLRR